ncbi:MAG: biotin transporter BioY [Acidobacteria bacterium]|nr:biotin transporter BioY [Acidobacteriota bacterium]
MPSTRIWQRAWPLAPPRVAENQWLMALAMVVLTALAAQIRIPLPFTPVPITLQVLVVLAAGYLLRPMAAAGGMALYLGLGAAGVPLFSGGLAGLGVLGGFSGGYLLACPLAAAVVSLLAAGTGHAGRRLAAGLAGLVIIHLAGAAWLALVFPGTTPGLARLLTMSLLPFLALDLAKLGVAEWLTRPPSSGS